MTSLERALRKSEEQLAMSGLSVTEKSLLFGLTQWSPGGEFNDVTMRPKPTHLQSAELILQMAIAQSISSGSNFRGGKYNIQIQHNVEKDNKIELEFHTLSVNNIGKLAHNPVKDALPKLMSWSKEKFVEIMLKKMNGLNSKDCSEWVIENCAYLMECACGLDILNESSKAEVINFVFSLLTTDSPLIKHIQDLQPTRGNAKETALDNLLTEFYLNHYDRLSANDEHRKLLDKIIIEMLKQPSSYKDTNDGTEELTMFEKVETLTGIKYKVKPFPIATESLRIFLEELKMRNFYFMLNFSNKYHDEIIKGYPFSVEAWSSLRKGRSYYSHLAYAMKVLNPIGFMTLLQLGNNIETWRTMVKGENRTNSPNYIDLTAIENVITWPSNKALLTVENDKPIRSILNQTGISFDTILRIFNKFYRKDLNILPLLDKFSNCPPKIARLMTDKLTDHLAAMLRLHDPKSFDNPEKAEGIRILELATLSTILVNYNEPYNGHTNDFSKMSEKAKNNVFSSLYAELLNVAKKRNPNEFETPIWNIMQMVVPLWPNEIQKDFLQYIRDDFFNNHILFENGRWKTLCNMLGYANKNIHPQEKSAHIRPQIGETIAEESLRLVELIPTEKSWLRDGLQSIPLALLSNNISFDNLPLYVQQIAKNTMGITNYQEASLSTTVSIIELIGLYGNQNQITRATALYLKQLQNDIWQIRSATKPQNIKEVLTKYLLIMQSSPSKLLNNGVSLSMDKVIASNLFQLMPKDISDLVKFIVSINQKHNAQSKTINSADIPNTSIGDVINNVLNQIETTNRDKNEIIDPAQITLQNLAANGKAQLIEALGNQNLLQAVKFGQVKYEAQLRFKEIAQKIITDIDSALIQKAADALLAKIEHECKLWEIKNMLVTSLGTPNKDEMAGTLAQYEKEVYEWVMGKDLEKLIHALNISIRKKFPDFKLEDLSVDELTTMLYE